MTIFYKNLHIYKKFQLPKNLHRADERTDRQTDRQTDIPIYIRNSRICKNKLHHTNFLTTEITEISINTHIMLNLDYQKLLKI
jgi:hypothetical protein